jgi:molybdopterin-guanine dinucleotide biosynthesis protein A
VLDDGFDVRAPLAGVVAGLRAAAHDICVVLPVDVPLFGAREVSLLADACRDAAVPGSGPLPGAYAKRALGRLERALASRKLALRDALRGLDVAVVELDQRVLVNVNTPAELAAIAGERQVGGSPPKP